MPQMAPYNWLNLYFMFSLILMYFITYIYFFYTFNLFMNKSLINKNYYSWQW